MSQSINNIEQEKILQIKNLLSAHPSEYWAFRGARREHAHGFIKYPAMMVPQMQREIINIFKEHFPEINSIYDPFVGSGTVLTEAMIRGLNFYGQDINPLAILACNVKKGPFNIKVLREKFELLIEHIVCDHNNRIDVNFKGLDKWFNIDISFDLSKLRRCIMQEQSKHARMFFWLSLVEIVRKYSNSRSTTFKLHIKSSTDFDNNTNVIKSFIEEVNKNISRLEDIYNILNQRDLIYRKRYKNKVELKCKSILLKRKLKRNQQFDFLLTSPPYGDNYTTVPYGQFSFLPLQWIERKDIPSNKQLEDYLESYLKIDRLSLGGKNKCKKNNIKKILNNSESLSEFILKTKNDPKSRYKKVLSFFSDMYIALNNIVTQMKSKAFMVFILGNRRVAGTIVPMNKIMREFLESLGAEFIEEIPRDIPSKRMAGKNKTGNTISKEYILIMRNC